jgi:hypothetical protein
MILLPLSLGIIWVSHTDLAPPTAFKALGKSQQLSIDTTVILLLPRNLFYSAIILLVLIV